jgi:hypothetical protein
VRRLRAFHHSRQNPICLNIPTTSPRWIPLHFLSFSPIIICVQNTVETVNSWLFKSTPCYKFVLRHVHWLVTKWMNNSWNSRLKFQGQ